MGARKFAPITLYKFIKKACLLNNLKREFSENKGDGIRITIIDSGVDKSFLDSVDISLSHKVNIKFIDSKDSFEYSDSIDDEIGHGTAILSLIHSLVPCAEFNIIKIFTKDSLEVTSMLLNEAIRYAKEYSDFDILHISSGSISPEIQDLKVMQDLCVELKKENKIIVSAFDNYGALSYPAALESVIGVDSSVRYTSIYDYGFVERSCINIVGRGIAQRVPWINGTYKDVIGSSFAATYITAFIAKFLENGILPAEITNKLEKYATKIYKSANYVPLEAPFKIEKAIVFPFNKETHSLVAYHEELSFDLKGIYSIRFDRNINKNTNEIIYKQNNNFLIETYDKINWDSEFDTLILGHCTELKHATSKDYKTILINKCLDYNKNVYSFDSDSIDRELIHKFADKGLKIFVPRFEQKNIIPNRFGKLKVCSVPIVAVVGTSSIQGKFHIQLGLKKCFSKDGYSVVFLGTEASSYLFGADAAFPFGYNSTVEVKGSDTVLAINQLIEKIEMLGKDIILIGSQAMIAPPSFGNLSHYPCTQTELLFGAEPDATVLCVNYTDSMELIQKSINIVESCTHGKVISIVLYPLIRHDAWSVLSNSFSRIMQSELYKKAREINETTQRLVVLHNEQGIEQLYREVVEYLSE